MIESLLGQSNANSYSLLVLIIPHNSNIKIIIVILTNFDHSKNCETFRLV